MKTNLLYFRKRIIFLCVLLMSGIYFGQTLIGYPLANNLNSNEGPIDITNPSLGYYDPPTTKTPEFLANFLLFQNSLDEVRFSFKAPSSYSDGMILQFTAAVAGLGFGSVSGNVKVYMEVDSQGEKPIEEETVTAGVFLGGFKALDFSIPLDDVNVNSEVKIRIVGTGSASGATLDYFGMNNLKLVKEVTKISVRSTKNPQPPLINHNDAASVTLDTDFGSLLTNDVTTTDKTYKITNIGSKKLKISSIKLVPNNVGFSIVGTIPTTISAGGNADFTVRFAPTDQGLKSADVVIDANIIPNNPFRFEVKGNGKSCNLEPIPIFFQNFETSGLPIPNLDTKVIGLNNPGSTGNTSTTPTPTIPGATTLFPSATNLYATGSATRSVFVRGSGTDTGGVAGTGVVTLEFGPVDITGQQEVSVNFEVAAFGLTNNTNSGVNQNDYVILQVYNGSTWVDALRLNGANDTTRRQYPYGASETVTKPADDFYLPKAVSNNIPSNKNYGKFSLNVPSSALSADFKFRIKAYTSQTNIGTRWNSDWKNYNLWLIDNVHIDAGNAKVKTWDGNSWIEGRPSAREKAKFTGAYDFSAPGENIDLSICECEVAEGVNLTIPSGRALQVQNNVINDGLGDNFVVASDGNLIQIENGAQNTGSVKVERSVNGVRNDLAQHMDYIYWSSPVSGQLLKGSTGFSPGTPPNRFYRYNEPNDFFYETGDTNFVPGKGYAIRAESGLAYGYEKTYNFKGAANNGIVNIGVQRSPNNGVNNLVQHGYNMIGNPYPSNIDFIKFYTANSTKIYNTAWFWVNDNITIYQTGNGYVGNGYAVYNGTGGNGAQTQGYAEKTPDEFIKVGQGFLVQMKIDAPIISSPTNTATLLFNNDMRAPNEGQFYSKSVNVKNRFWLKMVSSSDVASTMLLGYIPGATDDYEQDFDAESFGLSSDLLYSNLEDKRLIIQGKGNFSNEDKVAIGANFFNTGTYTISLMNPEGIFANGQAVYLKDKQTGIITKLTDGFYTFETNKGETNGRFEIIYKPETVLVSESNIKDALVVYRDSDNFVVRSPKTIATVEVYDLSGKLMTVVKADNRTAIIYASFFTKGMYVLRIKTTDGAITNKKILK